MSVQHTPATPVFSFTHGKYIVAYSCLLAVRDKLIIFTFLESVYRWRSIIAKEYFHKVCWTFPIWLYSLVLIPLVPMSVEC